ncbi:MFS transporter [Longispora albida]|uniref:MFS transporter n=1 Tax=Longispora albida TaxID=203523 RepID=UPI0012FBF149|nr:MFS transporter [Longispora albida]
MTAIATTSTTAGTYRQVFGHPVFRRILPGMLVSSLGDGMTFVAVSWLALTLAPAGERGLWTGLAVAAYALPASIGAAVLGPLVRRFDGARLVLVDSLLRCGALGTIAFLALAGWLSAPGYVALLAVSALLHSWGNAGAYTLVAERLPAEHHVTGNAILSAIAQATFIIGPGMAGLVISVADPGWVIAADAASFLVLAACAWTVRHVAKPSSADTARPASTGGTWHTLRRNPMLLGVIGVSFGFFFLYGPVEVALPVHIADELHASAGLLGAYMMAYGVGAVIGSFGTGLLRRLPLWPVVAVIIVGWGVCLLPSGLSASPWPGVIGFGLGGVIYGPFQAMCMALFQRVAPPDQLSQLLALRSAVLMPAAALGTALGGPLVGAIGGQQTLAWSAVTTIVLGVLLGLATWRRRA